MWWWHIQIYAIQIQSLLALISFHIIYPGEVDWTCMLCSSSSLPKTHTHTHTHTIMFTAGRSPVQSQCHTSEHWAAAAGVKGMLTQVVDLLINSPPICRRSLPIDEFLTVSWLYDRAGRLWQKSKSRLIELLTSITINERLSPPLINHYVFSQFL